MLISVSLTHRAHAEIAIAIAAPQVATDNEPQAQQKLAAIPGNTQLLDADAWSNQRAATIKDITDYVPGVFAQPRNGAESARLSIRGSGLASAFQGRGLRILQDGIPINTADGEFEFPVIDPWLIRYAEVYPGANALQFGASTFGGAINFITPTGKTNPGYELRGEGGSFGTVHRLLATGQQWQGGDLYAAASGFQQDGFRDHNTQTTTRFNGNFGWQPNKRHDNRFYLSHTHSNPEIPGAISHAEIAADAGQANPANISGDYRRGLDITRLAQRSTWEAGDERVETAVFYTYRTLDNPVTTYEFEHNNDVGLQTKYIRAFAANTLTSGFNVYYGTGDETRFRNVNGNPGAFILSRENAAMTAEGFTQYEHQLAPQFYGIAGTQFSYATRNINQRGPISAEQDKYYTGFTPRLGLRYDLPNAQLFTNLSRSFEPPTISDLSGGNVPGFKQLQAQTATTAEIGARGNYQKLNWRAAYYHGWLRNEFVNYRFASGATDTINAARTQRDGIELGLNGELANHLWLPKDAIELRTAYTFSHFTLDHDPLYGNNQLPGVPEHYLRTELLYRHPAGISFGPNIEWVPDAYPIDLTNSLYTKSYALFGARAFWASDNQQLNIYVEGRNLLDRNYIATTNVIPDAAGRDGRYFYPGEGRALYAGLQTNF